MRCFSFLLLAMMANAQDLMPLPASISMGQGRLAIDRTFTVAATGVADPRVNAAIVRFVKRLPIKVGQASDPATLVVHCERAGEPVQKLGEDESYRLEITPAQAKLTAPNALGILRGLETFFQLVEADKGNFSAPALIVNDAPRFPWRGLHIDVSRHWMPVNVVLRNLDGMAAVKMNVFHWHLSDDQGFRIESKLYPKLQGMGSDGNFYTQDQVREVVAYARARGIRVVPEFDIPAHSTAWLVGYPELGSAPGPYEIGRTWGIFEPTLDPTRDSVYTFLDGFIGEMARLFPDEFFHIGGDEVNGKQWDSNPAIVAYKQKQGWTQNHSLQAYFNRRIQAIVSKHGRRMEGWDEILDPDLQKGIVIQSWRGQDSLAAAARMGYQGLLSAPYYLDAMKPASEHYLADPMEKESASLKPDEKKRILGGEVCTWSEYLTPENIDSRIWPRTAAIAERFWSPQDTKDVPSMYRRLAIVSRELEALGLQHVSGYRLMLERLAAGGSVEPFKVLADVVVPVRLGGRARARKYTQQTPLNRLCDTAAPESEVARQFSLAVENHDWKSTRSWLILWRDNNAKLKPRLNTPLTAELVPISEELSALGAVGLQALEAIEKGRRANIQSSIIDTAKKPQAEVTLQIIPGIQKLIDLASR